MEERITVPASRRAPCCQGFLLHSQLYFLVVLSSLPSVHSISSALLQGLSGYWSQAIPDTARPTSLCSHFTTCPPQLGDLLRMLAAQAVCRWKVSEDGQYQSSLYDNRQNRRSKVGAPARSVITEAAPGLSIYTHFLFTHSFSGNNIFLGSMSG